MPSVSFQAPNEYSTELSDIERRRKYAELLQQQAMQPIQDTPTPAGGFAVPTSWTHGLAKMLQGYTARKGMDDASAQQKALGERYNTERGAARAAAMRAMQGTPASSETVMDEQAAGGDGQMAQINAPAIPGGKGAYSASLMGSKFPDLQAIGEAQMFKDQESYTLAPGASRFGPGGQVIANNPKPQEGFTLPPGGSRFDATGNPIATMPQKPEAPHTRSIQRGDQKVYQEFDPASRTWSDVPGASGPAFARQVPPVVLAGGGGKPQKAPVGYRFSSDGETLEPIPGGPKDTTGKPLPTQALKLQQAEVDAIGDSASINADLSTIRDQITKGKLDLGLVNNLVARGRNVLGYSDENSKNFATFKASMERARNQSLRLNKGVQTEGDAVRAWNELFENINDNGAVSKRLAEIEETNERAINLRKMNIDNIRMNYGAEPLDVSAQRNQPSAVGATPQRRSGDAPKAPGGVQEGATATGPGGKKMVFRSGQWVPM